MSPEHSANRLFKRNFAAARIQNAVRSRMGRKPPRAIQKARPKLPARSVYKLSKPMKSLVQGLVDKNKQDRWGIITKSQTILPYDAGANGGVNLLPLVPGLHQVGYDTGLILADIQTADLNARVGTAIKCKSIRGKYTFYVNPSTDQTNAHQALYLRVLTLSSKKYKTMKDIQINWTSGDALQSKVFLDNSTQPSAWWGRPDYVNHPVNRRAFTVHQDQKFLMTRGALIKLESDPSPDEYASQTHMPCMIKSVNIEVKCKNIIAKYDNKASEYPTNFAPFALAVYSTFSGNNSTVVNNTVLCHGSSKFTFENLD